MYKEERKEEEMYKEEWKEEEMYKEEWEEEDWMDKVLSGYTKDSCAHKSKVK